MPEGLKIQVGADVQQAVKSLKQLETQADATFRRTGGGIAASSIKAGRALDNYSKSTSSATQATMNLGRVIQDAPYGFIGIANNLNPLLEGFGRLKTQTGSTSKALKAMGKDLLGAGGLGLAVSLVSTGLILFGDKLFSAGKKSEEAADKLKKYRETVEGIFSATAKEAVEVLSLISVLRSETETRERKLLAIKELQKLQPDIFNNLRLEGQAVVGLDTAYKAYLDSLKIVIAVKVKQAQLEQKITEQLKQQGVTLTRSEKVFQGGIDQVKEFRRQRAAAAGEKDPFAGDAIAAQQLQKDINSLLGEITELSKGIKIPELTVKPDKIKIEPSKVELGPFGVNAFDFDQAQFENILKKIKIPAKGFTIFTEGEGPTNENISGISDLEKQGQELSRIFGLLDNSILTDMQKETVVAAQTISGLLTPAFQGLFDAILAGENPLKSFFTSLAQSVAQLIQKLIAAAIQAAILSALFPGGVGQVKGFGGFFKNILGFAAGGIVSGPTLALIGEGAGTSRSNPEVVAPLDQLRSMLAGIGGTGSQNVYVTGRLRGRDMVLQNARTSRSQRRTTGR